MIEFIKLYFYKLSKMTLDIPLNLETPVFASFEEQNFLHEWIKINNDNVKIQFISREEFTKFSWNFLKDSWNWTKTLYLPSDLKHWELPAIIKKINLLTPNVANQSTEEVWFAIKMAISRTIKLKDKLIINQNDYEKTIKKYIALYQSYFPEDKITNFSDPDFVEKLALEVKKREYHQSIDYEKSYKDALQTIKTEEELDRQNSLSDQMFSLQDIDSALARELGLNLTTVIAEVWRENILNNLKTVTKKDYQDTFDKAKKEWNKIETDSKWKTNIFSHNNLESFSVEETKIILNEPIENLNNDNIFLKNKLRLEDFKTKIYEAKTKLNIDNVSTLEKEFVELLVKEIFKYERNTMKWSWKTSSPNEIIKNKKAICAWKTFISDSFLEKLWIKHYTLEIPVDMWFHSASIIQLANWKEYCIDPTSYNTIWNIINKKDLDWIYTEIEVDFWLKIEKFKVSKISPERWIISQVISNNGSPIDPFNYKKSLLFNNNNIALINIWNYYSNIENYEEAVKYYKKALNWDPKNSLIQKPLIISLSKLWKNDEVIEYYKKFLENDMNNVNILDWIAWFLKKIGKYKESIPYYEKILELTKNENDYIVQKSSALSWLSEIYKKLWNNKKAMEYYNILVGGDWKDKEKIENILIIYILTWMSDNVSEYIFDKNYNNIFDANSFYAFAESFLKMKKNDLALKCIDYAIKKEPDNTKYKILREKILQN